MRRTLAFAVLILASGACGHGAPLARPVVVTAGSPPTTAAPTAFGPTDVDAKLRAAWRAAGVVPAARAEDAQWLRRVYLDLIGTVPAPETVNSFVADASEAKRAKLVDELLASPGYAEHWSIYWDDELMGRVKAGDLDRMAFRAWLQEQFAKNVPWDKVVYALITATGQNSVGGAQAKTVGQAQAAMEGNDDVAGSVNYVLRFRDTPQDFAGSASKTFLGVQIQCAQCHDHKTEKWKQQDFDKFAACFTRTQLVPQGDKGMKGIQRVEVRDLDRPAPRFQKNGDLAPILSAAPTALDGTALSGNVRQAVGAWITKAPWFAQEAVNRAWAHFVGRGFVDPVDDLRPSNPPEAAELFDALTRDFAEHGYDLHHLFRTIALSEAYALSPTPPPGAKAGPPELWSRFRMTPLGPEELLNAIFQAAGPSRRGKADVDAQKERLRQLYSFVFDVDEEFDRPSYEGTLTQALTMLNGKVVAGASSASPGTGLHALATNASMTDAQRIEALYLRTLSRKPTATEQAEWAKRLASAAVPAERAATLEDLQWTLLNSAEFIFNH